MTVPTAKSNCWTCKERKVGCDRALPCCANCTRAKRECKGYGLKLAWPDKYDGRRKQKKYQANPESCATKYITKFGEFCFLNTSIGDLESRKYTMRELVDFNAPIIDPYAVGSPGKGLSMWKLNMGERDGALLSYYDSVVARMITTIDDSTNGFRLELMPMALSSVNASSKSLLLATLALASFHLGSREEALGYKVRSIKALSESFHGADDRHPAAQFAACMMLCVYSVFDASDTSWNIHLDGARNICYGYTRTVPPHERRHSQFLKTWYEYHHTLSEFSHPASFYSPSPSVQDILIPESGAYDRRIVGLLGCSTELIRLISCVNQLRTLITKNMHTSESDLTALAVHLRMRLLNLRQEIHIHTGESTGIISHTRIHITAEFYRIGAILYLYNTFPAAAPSTSSSSPNSPHPFPTIPSLVRQAFMLLDQMEVCTSPWPLFVLACNVIEDRDRIEILRILEEGSRERRIGNYDIMTGLVKAVWKKADLSADEGRDGTAKIGDWRELVDKTMGMPTFG